MVVFAVSKQVMEMDYLLVSMVSYPAGVKGKLYYDWNDGGGKSSTWR